MIRLLIFILFVIFFAAIVTAFFVLPGRIPVDAFGWRMDVPAGVAVIAAALFVAVIFLVASTLKDLVGAPRAARARKEIAKREKGLAAVTRGLEAIAAGDGALARREAASASKALGGAPVAKLIAAQAAQISGDDAAAGVALSEMLEAPETEFLALRGLYAKARRDGDLEAARRYAERAFERRESARWAFEAVFDLALARGDFDAAAGALSIAARAKSIGREEADRGAAAARCAAAYAQYAAGDENAALENAEAALKKSPGFAPAAVLAARVRSTAGDGRRAEKILLSAFEAAPSAALLDAAATLESDASAEHRAKLLERLADKSPETREAALARAEAALLVGDASSAAATLAGVLRSSPSAGALMLMAKAQAALQNSAAERAFLQRAAAAPRDAELSAEACFRITGEGWRRLVRDYMESGRIAPPPLDAPPPGLSDADLALALPAPASAPADSIEEADAPELPAPEPSAAPAADNPPAEEKLERDAAAARGVG